MLKMLTKSTKISTNNYPEEEYYHVYIYYSALCVLS